MSDLSVTRKIPRLRPAVYLAATVCALKDRADCSTSNFDEITEITALLEHLIPIVERLETPGNTN